MPVTGCSVTKGVNFRGVVQDTSNVYFFSTLDEVNAAQAEALADAVVAIERAAHGQQVFFQYVRVWSAGGTIQQNEMLFQEALSGQGSNTSALSGTDPERAFLIFWEAGTNVLGRPVYLRKWYHTLANITNETFSTNIIAQQTPISLSGRANAASQFEDLQELLAGGANFRLCSETERFPTSSARCHPWWEHHQLGDEWRAS